METSFFLELVLKEPPSAGHPTCLPGSLESSPMDSDADDAALIFRVGPNSVAGRALALRVIFCKKFRHLLLVCRGIVAAKIAVAERWTIYVIRRLGQWLDPRSPHFVLAAVLCAALLLRRQRLKSMKEVAAYQCRFWSNLMRTALTYEEWAYAASMVEKYQESSRRKDDELYDEDLVRSKLEDLKQRRLHGDVNDIMFALRTDLLRNLGNMCNPELHRGRLQTPPLIQDYISEVRCQLRAVCDADNHVVSLEEKLAFIHETRHAFGRTALMLSGGAALGSFHLGVVRTLIEHRLLPRVLSGASVGSIVCSFVATRTWTELQQFFDDPMPPIAFFESMGSIFATAHRLLTKGALAEIGQLQRKMRLFIGDLTFQEAYDLSGRVLGIPVCSMRPNEPHRLLNYLTAPHVVIWSAVTASCAFPGLFEAQELMAKDRQGRLVPYHMPTEGLPVEMTVTQKRRWRDGSLESDLPMKELRELFNVNHFIVSQANPHIAPLLRIKEACRTYGGQWGFKLASMLEMEAKHRCQQALAMGWRWGGLAKLFAQEWEGDITIVMPATLAQFAKLIQNPTPSELRKAVIQGRRCTWERLSAIQANCGIELMLDQCVYELNQRRKQQVQAARMASAQACQGRALGHGTSDTSPCRDPSCCVRSGRGPLAMLQQQQLSSSWRRIPSWNRFARERSWGSLDDDTTGNQYSSLPTLGTGGGTELPPGVVPGSVIDYGAERSTRGGTRWLQGTGIQSTYHQGHHSGDSDSDTEGTLLYSAQEGSRRGSLLKSWTRAGGPLMSSPSHSCMLQLHDAAVAAASAKASESSPLKPTSSSTDNLQSPREKPSTISEQQVHMDQGITERAQGHTAEGAPSVDDPNRLVPRSDNHTIPGGVAQWGAPSGHPASLSGNLSFSHWAVPGYFVRSSAGPYMHPGQMALYARQSNGPFLSFHQAGHQAHMPAFGPGAPFPGNVAQHGHPHQADPTDEAITQLHASASASRLVGQGKGSQEQIAEDWRLRDAVGAELPLPPPTTATGEADEEGMLFGLAMESSMHGNRSASVPAHTAALSPRPGPQNQNHARVGLGDELLNSHGFGGRAALAPEKYAPAYAPAFQHPGGIPWAPQAVLRRDDQAGSAERLHAQSGISPDLVYDIQDGTEGSGVAHEGISDSAPAMGGVALDAATSENGSRGVGGTAVDKTADNYAVASS